MLATTAFLPGIKSFFITILALIVFFLGLSTLPTFAQETQPAPQSNNIADNVCRGFLATQGTVPAPETSAASCQEEGNGNFNALVQRIINIFSIVVGAVSVIMIIIGGFRYIISGGDSSGVSAAKNTILYAIVGLVIVLFAQVIIRFVLTNATKAL